MSAWPARRRRRAPSGRCRRTAGLSAGRRGVPRVPSARSRRAQCAACRPGRQCRRRGGAAGARGPRAGAAGRRAAAAARWGGRGGRPPDSHGAGWRLRASCSRPGRFERRARRGRRPPVRQRTPRNTLAIGMRGHVAGQRRGDQPPASSMTAQVWVTVASADGSLVARIGVARLGLAVPTSRRRCRSCPARRRGRTGGSTRRTGRAGRSGPAGPAWAGNPGSSPSGEVSLRAETAPRVAGDARRGGSREEAPRGSRTLAEEELPRE